MKRSLAIILTAIMLLALIPSVAFADDTAVVKIGNEEYTSLQEAISAVSEGTDTTATITLLSDIELDAKLEIGIGNKRLTLDLGGKTLSGCVNLVSGDLTVQNGTIKKSAKECQALNVYGSENKSDNVVSKLTLASSATVDADYGICVFSKDNRAMPSYGVMVDVYGKIVSGGIFVNGNIHQTTGKESGGVPIVNVYDGAVVNGANEGQGISLNGDAVVNIHGGTITGCEAVGVKQGTLNIKGGTLTATGNKVDPAQANYNGTEDTGAAVSITGTYTTYSPITVDISGGTIKSNNNAALYLGHSKDKDTGNFKPFVKETKISVTGGTLIGANEDIYIADLIGTDKVGGENSYTKAVVSGESCRFANPVDNAYLKNVKYENIDNDGYYYYTVAGSNVAKQVETVKEEPKVAEGVDKENQTVKDVMTALSPKTNGGETASTEKKGVQITEEVLTNTAAVQSEAVAEQEAKDALSKITASTGTSGEQKEIKVVVQPYLDVQLLEASTTGSGTAETATIKLDITPKYKTIVTTADVNNDEIVTEETKTDSDTVNAVQIGDAKELKVTKTVTVTIPIPANFFGISDTTVYIQHKGYVYESEVKAGATEVSFTNPHGFSEFVLTKSNPAVAGINNVEYADLQSAVNAAEDKDTITIKATGPHTAKMAGGGNRSITFTNETGANVTLVIDGVTYTLAKEGEGKSRVITYTAPVTPTTPIVIPSYTPSYSGSSSSSGNTYSWYFNPTPTPTPAPVLVAPAVALPKTGDMTIWQSILSFLGLL